MIEKIAARITEHWHKSNVISFDKKEIYVYGLEIILSTIWITICLSVISLTIGDIFFLVLYYACFMPLRGYCGGFHAKTHWGCALMQCFSFAITIGASYLLSNNFLLLPIIAFIIMFCLVNRYAPVEHPGNPIDSDKKKLLKRNGLITLTLILVAIFTLKHFDLHMYANIMLISTIVSITSMLFANSNEDDSKKK